MSITSASVGMLGVPRLLAGRAFRSKSSPLVPRGCGLSTSIPHAELQIASPHQHLVNFDE